MKKTKKKLTAMFMAAAMAVFMTACTTSDGATVPEGKYTNWLNWSSMTLSGTSIALDNVWTGWGSGSVTCTGYLSNIWQDISGSPAAGAYYWQATVNFKDKNNINRTKDGFATRNGRIISFGGYFYFQ